MGMMVQERLQSSARILRRHDMWTVEGGVAAFHLNEGG